MTPPRMPVLTPTSVQDRGGMPFSQARSVPEAQKTPRPTASAQRKSSCAKERVKRFTIAGAKIVKTRMSHVIASCSTQ